MNLAVKIYKKRYDGHNKTHWATNFFNSVLWFILILYPVHPKIKFHSLYWTKVVTDSNLTHLHKVGGKTVKKMHLESGLPICHKLSDIDFFFFGLALVAYLASLMVKILAVISKDLLVQTSQEDSKECTIGFMGGGGAGSWGHTFFSTEGDNIIAFCSLCVCLFFTHQVNEVFSF